MLIGEKGIDTTYLLTGNRTPAPEPIAAEGQGAYDVEPIKKPNVGKFDDNQPASDAGSFDALLEVAEVLRPLNTDDRAQFFEFFKMYRYLDVDKRASLFAGDAKETALSPGLSELNQSIDAYNEADRLQFFEFIKMYQYLDDGPRMQVIKKAQHLTKLALAENYAKEIGLNAQGDRPSKHAKQQKSKRQKVKQRKVG